MFKKITVLAMAVGVVAALALPASASAVWKHHNTAIQQTIDIPFTGQVLFHSPTGGIECQITSTATLFNGQTTGAIDSFTPDPPKTVTEACKGTGGLAFCQTHELTPTGLPHPTGLAHNGPGWTLHTNQGGWIDITYGEIHSQTTGAFCPITHITVTAGTAKATPNQPNTITTIALSGTPTIHIKTNGAAVYEPLGSPQITGSLTIHEASKKHTYSI